MRRCTFAKLHVCIILIWLCVCSRLFKKVCLKPCEWMFSYSKLAPVMGIHLLINISKIFCRCLAQSFTGDLFPLVKKGFSAILFWGSFDDFLRCHFLQLVGKWPHDQNSTFLVTRVNGSVCELDLCVGRFCKNSSAKLRKKWKMCSCFWYELPSVEVQLAIAQFDSVCFPTTVFLHR